MITKDDIPRFTNSDFSARHGRAQNWTDSVTLRDGYSVRVNVDRDESMRAPWKEQDGHGPVSDWRKRDSKRPGERILHSDRDSCLFYDFAAAVRLAKKDGWDTPPYKTGTLGQRAVRAVEADFNFLSRWCADEWYWVVVGVEVSRNGAVLEMDYCGGIESDGDYWREHAASTAASYIDLDQKARREVVRCPLCGR